MPLTNLPGVMVWAGVNQMGILGPYFFDGNVNGDKYLELLEELNLALDEDPRFTGRRIIFQQDGAPAHFTLRVRDFLNENFPNWIRHGGPTAWPPRSPDLTLLDFSVWGIIKDRVFGTPVETIEDLKNAIRREFAIMNEDLDLLRRMVNANTRRYLKCIEQNGAQFEHLL